ncbi:UDP-N-acetylmuramate-alanine ligase [Arthrobacter sp. UYP6]
MDSLVALEIFFIVLLGITGVGMAAFAGLVISRLYKGQK